MQHKYVLASNYFEIPKTQRCWFAPQQLIKLKQKSKPQNNNSSLVRSWILASRSQHRIPTRRNEKQEKAGLYTSVSHPDVTYGIPHKMAVLTAVFSRVHFSHHVWAKYIEKDLVCSKVHKSGKRSYGRKLAFSCYRTGKTEGRILEIGSEP